jgi:hypothetical protein
LTHSISSKLLLLVAARLKSQLPIRAKAGAARVFHSIFDAIATAVFDLDFRSKVQAPAPLIFELNHHAGEHALAPGVFHLNRRNSAPMLFHHGYLFSRQARASYRFFRKLRPV